jgi:hypothetical protein
MITLRARLAIASCAALGSAAAAPVFGQSSDWRQTFAVYLMGAGMDGEVGLASLTADVDVGFDDVLDHLRLGTMMYYAAERNGWTYAVDLIYMRLEGQKDVPPIASFQAKADQAVISLEAARLLGDRFEVLAGVRFNSVEPEIAITASSGLSEIRGRSEEWWDPFVGARYTADVANAWSVTLRADVGGFSVGADSAWQLVARADWHISDDLDLLFGYRILDVDYEDGEGQDRFLYDVQSSGPVIGFAWHF